MYIWLQFGYVCPSPPFDREGHGLGPSDIWNPAYSMSNHRDEFSGWIVMVQRHGTGYLNFCFPGFGHFLRMRRTAMLTTVMDNIHILWKVKITIRRLCKISSQCLCGLLEAIWKAVTRDKVTTCQKKKWLSAAKKSALAAWMLYVRHALQVHLCPVLC